MAKTLQTRTITLEDVRKQIADNRPQVKELRSLAELKLINPVTLDVGKGKTMTLDRSGMKTLCNELDMPKAFYKKLFSKSKQAWSTLTATLASQNKHPVKLIAWKDRIVAVVSSLSQITKHDEVLDIAGRLLKDKEFSLESIDFNGVDLSLHILSSFRFDTGKWLDKPIDMYQRGIVMSNSITEGFEARDLLKRLACMNLTYEEIPGSEKVIHDLEKVQDFLFGKNSNEIINLVKRHTTLLKSQQASLAEVFNVASYFKTPEKEFRPYMKEYVANLRLHEIGAAYGMNIDRLEEMPHMWKATVRTPFILYDLFNWITYIATHDERLSYSESNALHIEGGTMLFDPPDLASIAKEKIISKKPWILQN